MRYNIEHDKGTTLNIGLKLENGLDEPIDLTGYVFTAQVRDKKTCNLVAELTCVVLDQTTNIGEVEIKLSWQNSEQLPVDCENGVSYYFYGVESLINNEKTLWLKGDFIVYDEATR